MYSHIDGSLCRLFKFLQEWEPDGLVLSPDYSNKIEQREEKEKEMERTLRKHYNACVTFYDPTPTFPILQLMWNGFQSKSSQIAAEPIPNSH